MHGTKLLFLSLVVYVSGQGLSNYESSNGHMQSAPRPLYMPNYTPNVGTLNPVYSASPVNQPPPLDRTSLVSPTAYQPAAPQPSPYQSPPQTFQPNPIPPPVPVPEFEIPSQPHYSPISTQPAIPRPLAPQPRNINRRQLNPWNLEPTQLEPLAPVSTVPVYNEPPMVNQPMQPPIQPFECSRGNGYYPIENERNTYIECQNERAYKHSCPDGLHFNSQAVYPEYPCVHSSKVKCDRSALSRNGQVVPDMTARSEICTKRNGFFKQVGSCDSYIECREFYATNMTCPEGLHYNPNTTWPDYPCGYPMDVPCLDRGAAQPARPTADCPHQYGLFPALNSTPSNCGGYRKCVEGRAIDMACPIGLAFNDVTKRCDWPDQVPSCNPEEFLGFKCPPAPVDAYGKPLVLNYKYEGDCYYFISCETGRPRLQSCDFGFVFDPELGKCVDSDVV